MSKSFNVNRFSRGEISFDKLLILEWKCLFAPSLSIGNSRYELIDSWKLLTFVAISREDF